MLDFSVGYEFRKDKLFSKFLLKENENIILNLQKYKNTTKYQTHDLYLSTGYRKKLNDISIALNLEGHQLFNSLDETNKKLKESSFLLNSKLNFSWEINKTNRVFAFAENANSNANISDVYTNYILTGYRDFSRGTREFNQLNSTRVFAGYNLGNFGDRFIANITLSYIKDNDFLSTNAVLTPNFTQTTKLIIPNREFYSANAGLDRYVRFIRNNIKIKFSYSQAEFKNIVNSTNLRSIENQNYTYGLEIRSGFRGIFNYHFGTTWNTNRIKTTIENTATQNTSFLDLSFVLSSRLNLQLQSEQYHFNNLENDDDTYYFIDFEINYKPKNKTLSFSLIGNNVLDTKVFRNYSVSDTNISSTEYRLLPRYVLLKASYRF